MLVDKIDPHISEPLLSPRALYAEHKQNQHSITRFPKISSNINHHSQASINPVLTPKHSRSSFIQPHVERAAHPQDESTVNRGPKIYGKNLPDVFIPNTPGGKRIKKIISNIKESTRTESSFEKNRNPTRQIASQQNNRNVNSFVSPVRLIQIKNPAKRHPLYHNDSGNLSTIESITSRNNQFASETPTNQYGNNTHLTGRASVSPKNNFLTPFANPNNHIPSQFDRLSFQNPPTSANQKERIPSEELTKQIKKLIVFKKMSSKSPEDINKTELGKDDVKVKIISKDQLPSQVLQLNELITLKKIKTTQSKGVLKRMLHSPSFRTFDIQEEPISELKSKETMQLKDWLQAWKFNFSKSKYLAKIYACFWNSPEGCVSVLLEPAKDGFLSDLITANGTLPESCLQTVARDILHGIVELHDKTNRAHGGISPSEIFLSSNGHVKLAPGISQASMHSSLLPLKSASEESGANILKSKKIPSSGNELPQKPTTPNTGLAQDIFDFGLTLLQCAMGDMSIYDPHATLTPENIKLALESITAKKHYKTSCCILHNEDVIKKALGFISSSASGSNSNSFKKKVLTNNFSIKSPRPFSSRQHYSQNNAEFTMLNMLSLGNFSESFIDFLCCCLRLDPSQRGDARELLNHEFLSENHHNLGPLVSLSELLKLDVKDSTSYKHYADGLGHKHLDKFVEALKVVFLNKEVKQKFDLIQFRNGRTEIEEKRLYELSKELDVSPSALSRKLKNCLNDEDDD